MNTTYKYDIIWTAIDFEEIVKRSNSFADICRALGLEIRPEFNVRIRERILCNKIDASHLLLNRYKKHEVSKTRKKVPLNTVLIVNSNYSRSTLKKRLIKEDILENKCSECGLRPTWNNKKLIMILDHINGINNDNRLENLRLLCPNCNSQQDTFCKGSKCNAMKKHYYCSICNVEISKNKYYCVLCSDAFKAFDSRKKMNWPTSIRLCELLKEMSTKKIGALYGVSTRTVRTWAEKYRIKLTRKKALLKVQLNE